MPGTRRRGGDAAGLREHLDEDDGGNDRLSGEVALKVEIVGRGRPPSDRAHAGVDRGDRVQQPHRRLMRESIEPIHRGATIYFSAREGDHRSVRQRVSRRSRAAAPSSAGDRDHPDRGAARRRQAAAIRRVWRRSASRPAI